MSNEIECQVLTMDQLMRACMKQTLGEHSLEGELWLVYPKASGWAPSRLVYESDMCTIELMATDQRADGVKLLRVKYNCIVTIKD